MNIDSPHQWPAEWESQSATWIAWPHNQETWPGRFSAIPECFVKLANAISESQLVYILANATLAQTPHLKLLENRSNIRLVNVATNDTWIRDYGPTFVKRKDDGSLVGVCWKYNAWGGKYPPYDADAEAGRLICQALRCQRSMSSMYCEGGSLDGNGQGTVMTTANCLLNPNRNPGWTRRMAEEELQMQLGVKKVLWVDGGSLAGDDTDGHIDQIARFVNANTVVAAVSSTAEDPNREGLAANVQILRGATNANGEPLQVYTLPTPPPRFVGDQRVPESYCNFHITNRNVVVPTFRNERTDASALSVLKELFPGRTVLPLDAYDLSWGLGAFHCVTQQQPS